MIYFNNKIKGKYLFNGCGYIAKHRQNIDNGALNPACYA